MRCLHGIGLIVVGSSSAWASPLLGQNLLVNGDFETGDMSGWTNNGVDVVAAAAGGFAGLANTGVVGSFVATASTGATTQTASQAVDVSSMASLIDSGSASWNVRALLQARVLGAAVDLADVIVEEVDGSGVVLTSERFTDPSRPSGVYDWNGIDETRAVTTGTRTINVTLWGTRNSGASSDGFWDNVELAVVPAPGATGLAVCAGLIGMRRRR